MIYTKENVIDTFVSLFDISPRDSQVDIILIIVNGENPSTIINAGTGIGKSLIAVCAAHMLYGGYIVAPNRPLQWQYETDPFLKKLFDNGTLALLMGRANYPCRLRGCSMCEYSDSDECKQGRNCLDDYDDAGVSSDITDCSQVSYEQDCKGCEYSSRNCYEGPMCYYHQAKQRAAAASIRIINTAIVSYLPIIFTGCDKKPVIIYDEAHQLDGFYRMLCSKGLFNKNILSMVYSHVDNNIPHTTDRYGKIRVSVESYLGYYHPGELKNIRESSVQTSQYPADVPIAPPTAKIILDTYIGHMKTMLVKGVCAESQTEVRQTLTVAQKICENISNFVTTAVSKGYISIKYEPLFVGFMHAKVADPESAAPKEVLMSATIFQGYNDKVLGIDGAEYHEFDNGFKPENSPIYIFSNMSAIYSNRNNFLEWAPVAITRLLKDYKKRSLIHAHSKANMRAIISKLPSDIVRRLVEVNSVTEYRNCLENFKEGDNSILISASLKEGIDLKDDLCRLVILVSLSVPPPTSAEIVGYQNTLGLNAYAYVGATSLCQSMGRVIRSSEDNAKIFVLDNRLISKKHEYYRFMPPQWRRALGKASTVAGY